MIPRLTRKGRVADAKYAARSREISGFHLGTSRPSPAERLRQRRKARADAVRSMAAVSRVMAYKIGNAMLRGIETANETKNFAKV